VGPLVASQRRAQAGWVRLPGIPLRMIPKVGP